MIWSAYLKNPVGPSIPGLTSLHLLLLKSLNVISLICQALIYVKPLTLLSGHKSAFLLVQISSLIVVGDVVAYILKLMLFGVQDI